MHKRSLLNQAGKSFCIAVFLSLMIFLSFSVSAQQPGVQTDTLEAAPENVPVVHDTLAHNPHRAAIYSAVLPGLGQIYNRKYWKVPIIYAGFGTLVYFVDHNSRYYKDLKNLLIDSTYTSKYFHYELTPDQIKSGKDIYKRWRDLSIILTGGLYVLQIIDATVDAYLFDWNVSEDISLRIEPAPVFIPVGTPCSFGVRACLTF